MRVWLVVLGLVLMVGCAEQPKPEISDVPVDRHLSDTVWPWSKPKRTNPVRGFERWQKLSADGSMLDLFEFDFNRNPNLEFGLYDQDQHDAVPGDNSTDYFPKSVLGITRTLEATGKGKIVAGWNGLFFAYNQSKNPPNGLAKHIGPVVLEGKPSYNVGSNRWTFGLSKSGRFETRFKPKFDTLDSFRYAADGAQCLIRDGVALRVEPTPMLPLEPGTKPARIEPTFQDAGNIPIVDHIRTSRVSMGWTRDSKKLYVLIVFEPDTETESIRRLREGLDLGPGWDLFDLQRFWLSMDVWGAVNIDGGNVAQFVALQQDGSLEFQPSVSSGAPQRTTVVDEKHRDPGGGTLLTFWVREGR